MNSEERNRSAPRHTRHSVQTTNSSRMSPPAWHTFCLRKCPGRRAANLRSVRRGDRHSSRRSRRLVRNVPAHAGADGRFVGIFSGLRVDASRRRAPALHRRLHKREYRRTPPLSTSSMAERCSGRFRAHVFMYTATFHRAFIGQRFQNITFLPNRENCTWWNIAEAVVVINPAWIGTGLKIKTIEALNRGKPLVTTPKGIDGLPQAAAQSASIVEDDQSFARAIIRLMTDGESRQALSRSALAFANAYLKQRKFYQSSFSFSSKPAGTGRTVIHSHGMVEELPLRRSSRFPNEYRSQ